MFLKGTYQYLTYGEVDVISSNLASGLKHIGLDAGDRVLIISFFFFIFTFI
jgi:long-subunit acyl-CoA synthetase (AMP-forming)